MPYPKNVPPSIDEVADALMDSRAVERWSADHLLSHGWLDTLTEIPGPRPDTPYKLAQEMCLKRATVIEALKKTLLERFNVALQSKAGAGYVIVPAREQVAWAVGERRRRVQKVLNKSRQRIQFVDTSLLTAEGNRERTDELARVSGLQSIHRRKKGEI